MCRDYSDARCISRDSLIGSCDKHADMYTEITELLGLSQALARSVDKTDGLIDTERTSSSFDSLGEKLGRW